MRGRGERLCALPGLPRLPALLVNPGIQLGAGGVYEALNAGLVSETPKPSTGISEKLKTIDDLVGIVSAAGNDLEVAAIALAPVIEEVRGALTETKGCLIAQMSGSGPTCFGIYRTRDDASEAAQALARQHPDWWVVSTELG